MIRQWAGKIVSNSLIQHLGFWVLSFYVIGDFFSISNEIKVIDFIYAAFFHIPLLLLVYANIRLMIPHFLRRERFILYVISALISVILAFYLHQLIFDIVIPVLPTEFYMVSFTDPSVLISIFLIYFIVSTLLKLSKSWYVLQVVEKEKLNLELNALRMQINPHFLFNSLNSIYSLTRKKSDSAEKAVLGLSDLLRYMIYDVSDNEVPISKELEALDNFIHLQKLRLDEDANIETDIVVQDESRKIAPLIFLTLVENSFKHGLKSSGDNFVHIKLHSDENGLNFEVRNNKSDSNELKPTAYGGIGLDNVKQRLELIYGKRSEILIKENNTIYTVIINLKWHD